MNVEGSARAWALGLAAFALPVAIVAVYIWASRSVSPIHAIWLKMAWMLDLGALAFSTLVGALLAWMAVRGWARGVLLGAYMVAVLGALYVNIFCRIAVRLYGACP
jgi:hypothetical protein